MHHHLPVLPRVRLFITRNHLDEVFGTLGVITFFGAHASDHHTGLGILSACLFFLTFVAYGLKYGK